MSIAQAAIICSEQRFFELLRKELLVAGRNSLKARVFAYHRVRPPTPPKLIPESKNEAKLRGSVERPPIIAHMNPYRAAEAVSVRPPLHAALASPCVRNCATVTVALPQACV